MKLFSLLFFKEYLIGLKKVFIFQFWQFRQTKVNIHIEANTMLIFYVNHYHHSRALISLY